VGKVSTIHIVQDNEASSRVVFKNGTLENTIQIYASTPVVDLFVNGVSQGQQAVARYMWATFQFPYTSGNLTAVGYTHSGVATVSHTVQTVSDAVGLVISVDVPSAITGTGDLLLLDGQDQGLLRVEVVDHHGRTLSRCIAFSTSATGIPAPTQMQRLLFGTVAAVE
jgi:hypothetical protein